MAASRNVTKFKFKSHFGTRLAWEYGIANGHRLPGCQQHVLQPASLASRGYHFAQKKLFLFRVIVGPRARLSLSQEPADVVESQAKTSRSAIQTNRAEGGSTETRFIFRPPQRKFNPMFIFRDRLTFLFACLCVVHIIAVGSQQTWVRDEEVRGLVIPAQIARGEKAVVSRRKARFAGVSALWLRPRKDDYARKAKAGLAGCSPRK
ncbi:hypothetical protein H112_07046 [Trichophyton rubrum D6]|uniref:Uncharacterized protein n=1 Tax=Trichophyton rubrum CBS 288.86 TaxID=1215330 RepID=A0A022VSV0_TRIRU|nr:hypothetical protein H100_07069 [Trichophyton rubrum MR850]EZF38714.1 hypothetical protein H102_07032 [Trichophyton rubrum CBS 100081]EZF49347.1 hypothetical protein H103_07053 [Trichophyton rubrum CBS 288.86]EZF59962.1 hypothetical protein H104_07009 [Trichophyton rubrum CBS 289.86]EZF81277.1 hypothetical protein H110_07050 [Trichophyton rubrum MR1448]EZF91917.1 hypothetical protein H113_07104 [Trichophyton rubrum MR1459]EZG13487.1 hypothetical protein H107_07214 [Trichophyton rubrum CBS 